MSKIQKKVNEFNESYAKFNKYYSELSYSNDKMVELDRRRATLKKTNKIIEIIKKDVNSYEASIELTNRLNDVEALKDNFDYILSSCENDKQIKVVYEALMADKIKENKIKKAFKAKVTLFERVFNKSKVKGLNFIHNQKAKCIANAISAVKTSKEYGDKIKLRLGLADKKDLEMVFERICNQEKKISDANPKEAKEKLEKKLQSSLVIAKKLINEAFDVDNTIAQTKENLVNRAVAKKHCEQSI